eukprot:Phypoly_transcript_08065.p1 GENE.Phypoly_transcript_08065~~Phypoly_transcript_08065.p1  ORF type:complete len:468 (+),score=69.61 Phypoly_transcript_08065:127-1530(+)
MEQEGDFVNASVILKELEVKLSLLNESDLAKKQSEAHREIEIHFEKCLKALALRKLALIQDVDAQFNEEKSKLEKEQSQVKDSISTCKKLMEAGITIYKHHKSAAVYCWKGANELKSEPEKESIINVELPEAIMAIIDSHGCVYSSKEPTNAIFDKAGAVTTFAGTTDGYKDSSSSFAQFSSPLGVVMNPFDSCLYVTDSSNNMIRKVTMQGEVSTFVGKKKDGPFHYPSGIDFWRSGKCFFVSSQNHTINKITTTGEVTVYAGSGKEGSEDAVAEKASFKHPSGLAVDQSSGTLYVSDCGNHSIRKITTDRQVVTLVGPGRNGLCDVGTSPNQLSSPYGLCFCEKEHSLVVCDYGNNRLRKIPLDGAGKMSTICEITKPSYIAAASNGIFFVSAQNKIFKVAPNLSNGKYDVEVLAGSSKHGNADSSCASDATFNHPSGIALCENLNICFVADHLNSRIRKIGFFS